MNLTFCSRRFRAATIWKSSEAVFSGPVEDDIPVAGLKNGAAGRDGQEFIGGPIAAEEHSQKTETAFKLAEFASVLGSSRGRSINAFISDPI